MSTKIYYGCRINLSFHEIIPFLKKFHESLKLNVIIDNYNVIYTYCTFAIKILNVESIITWDVLYKKYKSLIDEIIRYQIAIIPLKSYTLAIPYFPNNTWFEKFISCREVQYWGYWNNTDKDENCSDKEWQQRYKDWKCLSYGMPVCKESLIFEPFTDYEFPSNLIWGDYDINPIEARDKAVRVLMMFDNFNKLPFYKLKHKIPVVTSYNELF